jgi:hypothetical protein
LNAEDKIKLLAHYMDTNDFNIIHYVYLRRVNVAWKECSEGFHLSPTRLTCALSVTFPRTKKLDASDEKALFRCAIILSYGFDRGQLGGIRVLDFVQIAYIYGYLAEYEISFTENISQEVLLRGI